MSRNNLLLSLLANNPNSRSNSLANRQGLSPTMSFFSRPSSNSLQKAEKKESNKVQTSTQIFKLVHMLNVKLKQSYYFVFCKLQQIYKNKKSKTDQSKSQSNIQKKNHQELHVPKNQNEEIKMASNKVQKTSIPTILSKIGDWHSAFITKIKPQSDSIIIKESFNKIFKNSQHNYSLQKIQKILKKRQLLNSKIFFDKVSSLQNAKIKIQILIDTLNQLTHRLMFYSLKNLQIVPTKSNIQQFESISSLSKLSKIKTEPYSMQTSIFETSQLTDRPRMQKKQASRQKASRNIKIKVKEKHIPISKPIKLQSISKLNKALRFNFKQPSTIPIDQKIFEDTNQPKNILINLHHQHLNIPINDFADSSSIFTALPNCFQERFLRKNNLITQPIIQLRKSEEMLPTEEGSLTERAKAGALFGQQKQAKSVSFKHNSLGKMKSKKVLNISRSPLKKVEELYKTIQQFNSLSTSNKHKKLININLPNFLNNQYERIRSSKTPLKQPYEQTFINISNKQNNRQRLITERDKQKLEKGGLQESGSKYKSSILAREKKVKADKVQLSTARKMKMEIQNIINRRNKQLGRNQLYQLK